MNIDKIVSDMMHMELKDSCSATPEHKGIAEPESSEKRNSYLEELIERETREVLSLLK